MLYYRGLRVAFPSTAVLVSLLESLTAAILGVLVLGVPGITGAFLLGASVVHTMWTQSPARSRPGPGSPSREVGPKVPGYPQPPHRLQSESTK